MIVVASANGDVGIRTAIRVLTKGGSALDAVEAGIKPVELNTGDLSVGVGGLPNLLGEVELDASIMDGQTRAAGSVGALKHYPHPISVARRVMEVLPHVFLVGEGAALFAEEMGFSRTDLLTEQARRIWAERLAQADQDEPASLRQYYDTMRRHYQRLKKAVDPTVPNETVNFLALDRAGHLAGGVSTSGWALKYPGRLGDSPIIGAGNYADDRSGAAACTGRGELAIRACTAFATVTNMKLGMSPTEACIAALQEVLALRDDFAGPFNIVALRSDGEAGAASSVVGSKFIVMRPDDSEPEYRPRVHVQATA
ncbi:MAG: N(4)-(beta-N-acetylglucosaminyl)-L-asparaginase [Chloroflexi bacterium]|nr:N(4)-(beta-N-acetylglucosaminyl)-L-asparaginase [Chloroflexota bacterium]